MAHQWGIDDGSALDGAEAHGPEGFERSVVDAIVHDAIVRDAGDGGGDEVTAYAEADSAS